MKELGERNLGRVSLADEYNKIRLECFIILLSLLKTLNLVRCLKN